MNNRASFQRFLQECPIVAILRGITPPEVPAVCDALFQGGIRLLEIPLNSPQPEQSIALAARHCAGRQLVGAGTVLSPAEVQLVLAAGGQFVVSPNTDAAVIQATLQAGLVSVPGFMTASEAFAALQAGANYLKLFPAGQLGPGYIRDLLAVIKAPILAVGGITAANLESYLAVCSGAGVGSALYSPGCPAAEVLVRAQQLPWPGAPGRTAKQE
ncbi:MAG: 2-dehydro-3-deoxy-6-phosphogalactonate aldolase [Oligosphaeraceae bacterium]|mgnify:CR=1 FL=1|nr:2-dehydro-3-deoxy-6-phosphogalactonate aldolase [Oligosphaeraceae bacterium]